MKLPLSLLALPAAARLAEGILYVRSEAYVGQDFFEPYRWNFADGPDPTHGFVDFVDYETAAYAGLVNATTDRAYMGADHSGAPGKRGRPSVRIESKAKYNRGLFIITLDHVPTGCGVWPAFWLYGEDAQHKWPSWGELDIIEGVHNSNATMTTLHTTPGCNQSSIQPGVDFTTDWMRGMNKRADDCDIGATGQWGNQGCSQKGPPNSMGPEFNRRGGGTFATEWDPEGGHVRTWFWPADGYLPMDIAMHAPDPDSWGRPYSYFGIDKTCPAEHFKNMRMVFDLTFCGDLGGPTFAASCPEHAAKMTCQEFVAMHPEAFREAYWSVRGLDVYQVGAVDAGGELSILSTDVEPTYLPLYNVLMRFSRLPGPVAAGGQPASLAAVAAAAAALTALAALLLMTVRRAGPCGPRQMRVDREGFAQHSQLPLAPAAEFPTEVQAVVAPSGEV